MTLGSNCSAQCTSDSEVGVGGVDTSGGAETRVGRVEERTRLWACRLPRCSSVWFMVMNREVLVDVLGCEATDKGGVGGCARRNPALLRVCLTGGPPFEGFGCLDMEVQENEI